MREDEIRVVLEDDFEVPYGTGFKKRRTEHLRIEAVYVNTDDNDASFAWEMRSMTVTSLAHFITASTLRKIPTGELWRLFLRELTKREREKYERR